MRTIEYSTYNFDCNTGFVKSATQHVKVHMNKLLQMYRFQ